MDQYQKTSDAIIALANAITPLGVMAGKDATGGSVGSLTEAMMGITAGLVQIADAINNLADATGTNKSDTTTNHQPGASPKKPCSKT